MKFEAWLQSRLIAHGHPVGVNDDLAASRSKHSKPSKKRCGCISQALPIGLRSMRRRMILTRRMLPGGAAAGRAAGDGQDATPHGLT